MPKVILVAVGGAVGSALRYAASGATQELLRSYTFPVGTLLVNLVACFLLGAGSHLVDTRERLEAFLAEVDPAISEGLATIEKAYVHFYRARSGRAGDGA